ncbi:MAG: hypothetical protein ACE5Q6_01505 [Dehalococcoidia bacterium]
MIAQQNPELTQTQETNEEQNARRNTMAVQMMVGRNLNQAINGNQPTVFAPATEESSSNWANLTNRLSQLFWRVSFEVEPVFKGLFSPFTAQIRRCRLLSSRDKAELEILMKRR